MKADIRFLKRRLDAVVGCPDCRPGPLTFLELSQDEAEAMERQPAPRPCPTCRKGIPLSFISTVRFDDRPSHEPEREMITCGR